MYFNALFCVLRTRRLKPTILSEQKAQVFLIKTNKKYQKLFHINRLVNHLQNYLTQTQNHKKHF